MVAQLLDGAQLHGGMGMLVEMAADTVDLVEAPLDLLAQGDEELLNRLVDGVHAELGILRDEPTCCTSKLNPRSLLKIE